MEFDACTLPAASAKKAAASTLVSCGHMPGVPHSVHGLVLPNEMLLYTMHRGVPIVV